jgi:ATP-dependent protease HslVU (ClpYQ) peptidase subunit
VTCVVGIAHKGHVILAGDSSVVDDQDSISTCAEPKVFTVGPVAFGFAGDFRSGDLLRYLAGIPTPAGPVDRWARQDLVPQLRKAAHQHEVDWSDTHVLVAADGRLFFIDSNWAVIEPAQMLPDGRRTERYAAIGSGAAWAQGCLYALHRDSGLTLRQRAEEALSAAATWCASVCGPFRFVEI